MKRITTISLIYLGLGLGLASGCASKPAPAAPDPGNTDPAAGAATQADPKAVTPPAEPGKPALSPEEIERQKRLQRVADARARIEAAAAKEAERWTDGLHAQAKALVEAKQKNPKRALQAILASPHRVPGNADRDVYRHPVETLMFFGIKPNMTVVEVGAGQGWYSEVLAPFLAKKGKLLIADNDPDGPEDWVGAVYGLRVKAFLAKSPEIFGAVEFVPLHPPDKTSFGPPGSADMVLVTRELHAWYNNKLWDANLAATHEVLKPGGILAIVQHRSKPGMEPAESAKLGYMPEEWVIKAVEQVGFKLQGKSEINANPKDTKDYDKGVWTLPPSYRLGDVDKAKYTAIGESDRMTLKFVKKGK
jgi:predicted methyltransferase